MLFVIGPKNQKCLEIFAEDKGKWEGLTQKLSSPCQPGKSQMT